MRGSPSTGRHGRYRIAVDASSILKERTGVGTYTYHLLRNLARRLQHHELIVWTNGLCGSTPPSNEFDTPDVMVKRTRLPGKMLLTCWKHLDYPRVETLLGKIDLFHSPNFFCHPHTNATRTVATIHDLFFLTHPEKAERYGGIYFREMLPRYAGRIDHFIAVSEWTKKDLIEHLSIPAERITVIHHGVDPRFLAPTEVNPRTLSAACRIDKPFFLSVGTVEPRKNYAFMIEAFDAWRKRTNRDCLLVIAGRPGWGLDRVRRTIEDLHAGEWVRMPGYVGTATLHALYVNCRGVLLSTLYEGFCLPALEAMACGAPVLAPDTSALREVLDDAALFFPPGDVEAFLDGIDTLLEQDGEGARRVRAGRERAGHFTWEKAAVLTCGVYEKVLGGG